MVKVVVVGEAGMSTAAQIKAIRTQRGLTLVQVADALDSLGRSLDYSAVAKIEKGYRRLDVDDLVALAAVLGVSPADLLGVADVPAKRRASSRDRIRSMRADEAKELLITLLSILE